METFLSCPPGSERLAMDLGVYKEWNTVRVRVGDGVLVRLGLRLGVEVG